MKPGETTTKSKRTSHKRKKTTTTFAPPLNGSGHNGRKKRDLVADELLLELRELRANLDELTEQFRLRMGGQLIDILQAVEGVGLEPKPKRLSAKTTAALLREIRAQPLKPHKGRAKDFVRLQNLLKSLAAHLPADH